MYDFSYELNLSYTVDPRRDYRDEVNAAHPPWTPAPYQTDAVAPSAALADQPPKSPREVYDHKRRRTYVTSHIKTERALDPNGLICPVHVSSARPTPDSPGGDDGIGTYHRVRGEKQNSGWLFLEPGDAFMGRSGDEYLAWVFAVRDVRKARYEAEQAANDAEHQSKVVQLLKQQANMVGEMTNMTAEKIAQAIASAISSKPKKGE